MKRIFKIYFLTLLILSMTTSISLAYASPFSKKIGNDGKEYTQVVFCPDNNTEISMLQGSDMIGELPPVIIHINDERVKGSFIYPNYDNTRLGIWDLEWVFIPSDTNYESISGTIKLNVRPQDIIEEEITFTSLTATTVLLDKSTTYDINLLNKTTGSLYKWTSSDTEVVEVNKSGLLKAKSDGTATITCNIVSLDNTVQILTSDVTVGCDDNAPLLTETELDLEVGDIFDIDVDNLEKESKVKFVSSDKTIAKVTTSSGKITGLKTGNCIVTCTITKGTEVVVLICNISVES